MKFTASPLCSSGKYCHICRELEQGKRWRSVLARMYPEAVTDFECPLGKPWLTAGIDGKSQHIGLFKLGNLVSGRIGVIELELGLPQFVIQARELIAGVAKTGGCTSCRQHKVMIKLGELVNALDVETRQKVYTVLGLR